MSSPHCIEHLWLKEEICDCQWISKATLSSRRLQPLFHSWNINDIHSIVKHKISATWRWNLKDVVAVPWSPFTIHLRAQFRFSSAPPGRACRIATFCKGWIPDWIISLTSRTWNECGLYVWKHYTHPKGKGARGGISNSQSLGTTIGQAVGSSSHRERMRTKQ